MSQLRDRLRSVVAIPVTPFSADGGIDEDCYQSLVRLMVDGGITVLTPPATPVSTTRFRRPSDVGWWS